MPILKDDGAIRALLSSAKTVAVVGLSDKPGRDSYHIAEILMKRGYRVIPVNPAIASVFGIPAVATLDDIAEHVDIVDVFRRPEFMGEIVDAAIRVEAGAVWMQFDTADAPAAEKAARAGLNVVVDRCIMVEHNRLMR